MNKVFKNILITCGCVAVLGGGSYYVINKSNSSPKTETATITYAAVRGNLSKTVTSSGNVEASQSVDLNFSGNAKVTKVNVNVGDSVKKGQVLAEMDAIGVQNGLLSAQANYDSAVAKLASVQEGTDSNTISDQKYQVSKSKSDLSNAETALTTAKKIANTAYLETLVTNAKTSVIEAQTKLETAKQSNDQSKILFAQVTFDNAQNAYKQAVAQQNNFNSLEEQVASAQNNVDNATRSYNQAVSQLAKLQKGPGDSEVASAKASVALALASLNDAKSNVEGAKIIAPFDGMVSVVGAKVGESLTGKTSEISMFSTTGNYKISASIDDTDITDIKVGQDVNITFDAFAGLTMKGKVVSRAVLGESQSSGVVTFPVGIEITSGQQNGDKLIPGLSATIEIITDGKKDVIKVPDAAIKSFGGKKVVMVDKNGKSEQTEIKTGLDDGANSEVLTGLNEGDKVTITMTTTKSSTTTQNGFAGMGGFGGGQNGNFERTPGTKKQTNTSPNSGGAKQ